MFKFNDGELKLLFVSFFFRWQKIMLVTLYAIAVACWTNWHKVTSIPFLTLSTVGTALAMLTAFRFRLSYDTWRESLIQWQNIVDRVRSIIRLVFAAGGTQTALSKQLISILSAFIYSFHYVIRNRQNVFELHVIEPEQLDHVLSFLDEPSDKEHLRFSQEVPMSLLSLFTERLRILRNEKAISDPEFTQVLIQLNELGLSVGVCERVKSSALPKRYAYLFNFLIYVFTLGIPWCLTDIHPLLAIFFTVLNYLLFSTLEDLGRRTEVPFGTRKNDFDTMKYVNKIIRDIEEYRLIFKLS